MSKAVIISAGTIADYEYTKAFIAEDDFVICADGGISHAKMMGVTPNLTVGDFDSYKGEVTGDVRRFNPEKDYTDTDIAVKTAMEKGYKEIILLGATGTRLDHTISNIGLLEYITKTGGEGYVVNENNIITVIDKKTVIKPMKGWHLSLIPIGEVKGVTLKNLKYPLENYDLKFSQSLAVSNEFTDKDAVIDIKEGSLIVIKSRD
ncbi:MAG: thiamine diphosphokinase [Clostridia bacterium]|nr:thiamine diphosphokinase [Clostridia bacterium]